MMKMELRDNKLVIDAYANVTNRDSKELRTETGEKFIEQTTTGMWDKAIRQAENIDFLLNHNENFKLGSTSEGSLKLYEDSIGLRCIAEITDNEVIAKAKNNKINGFSFGFRALKDRFEQARESVQRRFLDSIELIEVSILDNTKTPAYSGCGIVSTRDNNSIEYRDIEIDVEIQETEEIREHEEVQDTEVKLPNFSVIEKEIEILKLKAIE